MVKTIFQKNLALIIVSSIYLISIFIVAPWGNYPVGDDFYHYIQIKLFQTGDYYKNGQIGPSLVLQAFLGLLWTNAFGLNFLSLKILTIIFTLLSTFIFIKILKNFKTPDFLIIIATLIFLFNPTYYYLSVTFNTEIYFTFFLLLGLYNLIKFNDSRSLKYLYLTCLFGGLSVLIRQNGVLLFLPISLIIFLNLKYFNFKKEKLKLFFPLLIFLILSFAGIFWPRYFTEYRESSSSALAILNFESVLSKTFVIWEFLPYFSLIVAPLAFVFFRRFEKKLKYLILFGSLVLGLLFYQINIFNVGNIVYIEGLGARSYTDLRLHLLNNNPTKILIAIFFGFSLINFLTYLFLNFRKEKISNINLMLIFSFITFSISTVLSDVLYDRYLLYSQIILLLYVVNLIKNLEIKLEILPILVTYVTFTILYSMDFYYDIGIKWKMSDQLSINNKLNKEKIFVQDNYLKFNFILNNQDYSGVGPLKPSDPEYICFVVNDIEERPSYIREILEFSSRVLNKTTIFGDTGIEGYGFTPSQVIDCKECKILEKEYYFSPIYEIIGVSKFVKSYCLDKK